MPNENPLWFIKEIGGALKLGSGLLGKSAIALCVWLGIILIAVFRLNSDFAIVGVVAVGGIGFFLWFFPVIGFAKKNPAEALLEGAEWSGFKKFQASAKNHPSLQEDTSPIPPIGTSESLPVIFNGKKDQETEVNGNG
jgi:hypothetical protein